MPDDTQPIQVPHDENIADWMVDAIRALYHKTPVTSIYGLASLVLALSNMAYPSGGLALLLIGSWNMSVVLFQALMLGFALTGLALIVWPLTGKPAPKALVYPFLIYLGLVIISTFAAALAGLSTWGTFGKSAAIQLAHGWLLTRELTWPE